MQNSCDKIQLENGNVYMSPAFKNIISAHYNKQYLLCWYMGQIRLHKGKESIIKGIKKRFSEANKINRNLFEGTSRIKAVEKFEEGTKLFLEHFKQLTHSDINKLIEITPEESRGYNVDNKYLLKTIGSKTIKIEEN